MMSVDYDVNDPAHRQRSDTTYNLASGRLVVPGYFSTILPQVNEIVKFPSFPHFFVPSREVKYPKPKNSGRPTFTSQPTDRN
jgi:hypothetical protein